MNIRSLSVAGVLLATACGVAYRLASTKQPPAVFSEPPVTIVVDTLRVQPTDYPVQVKTRGQIVARTESGVVTEVSGIIRQVSPNFREGGFFESGEVLLKLDDRDYLVALASAESSLATAQTLVAEEMARSQQAISDWKSLGRKEAPPALVARTPQVNEAKAKEAAMVAMVEKSRRDLERTVIKAPYKGRVLEKTADVGQFIASGREIGKIFAVDYVEARLPIADEQLAFVNVPESYRENGAVEAKSTQPPAKVTLFAEIAGQTCQWEARIVRSSATVDSQTLQSYVTVQVDDPYARRAGNSAPLKVGQWVEASLEGKVLQHVVKLPRSAVRDGNEVLVVAPGNKLQRRSFTRAWADPEFVLASAGFADGELICTTPLSFAVEGAVVTPVQKNGQPPANLDLQTKSEPKEPANPQKS